MSYPSTPELEQFALTCRQAFEGLAPREGSMFFGFPRGCCGNASHVLGSLLIDRLGLACTYVCGEGHPALSRWSTHAWVETQHHLIDLTHDQCQGTGLTGWVFPLESAWHGQFQSRAPDGICKWFKGQPYPFDAYKAAQEALDAAGVRKAVAP